MNYIFIILAFVISVCIALFVIPRILLISLRKRLFDIPDKRKIHTCAIPRLGGVSFFPTILFSCCLVLAFRTITGYYISDLHATCFLLECLFLVCGLTLLYLTGITDDLIGVRYRQKFVIQILCACFFSIAELWINDLYGLLGIYAIPNWIGIPFTILTIVFITNAINLIRKNSSFVRKIEVETENLDMVKEALTCNADIIMLDNMSILKKDYGCIVSLHLVLLGF